MSPITQAITKTAFTSATVTAPLYKGSVLYRSLRDEERPLTVVSASGMEFTTDEGKVILDGCGGAAVTCLGHANEEVLQTMQDQMKAVTYAYNYSFTTPAAEELAQLICDSSQGAFDRVGYLSGGSEAVEAALKLARQYWVEIGEPQRVNFIARKMSYHGNTLGSLCASYHPARRALFEPILATSRFHHVEPVYPLCFMPANIKTEAEYVAYLKADLEKKFEDLGGETVIAFMCEPIVGATSGAVVAPKGYIKACREVCDKYGALLILDEVMCGMGRSGEMHAWQVLGDGAKPDLQTVAKGLGGGLVFIFFAALKMTKKGDSRYQPIGAVLLSPRVSAAMVSGSGVWLHGHTYQAHPVACAAALAVQKIIARSDLFANVRTMGTYLGTLLHSTLTSHPTLSQHTGEVRGLGCMWAVEYVQSTETNEPFPVDMKPRFGERVSRECLKSEGLLLLSFSGGLDGTKGDFTLFSPAFTIKREMAEDIVGRYVRAFERVVRAL